MSDDRRPTIDDQPFDVAPGSLGAGHRRPAFANDSAAVAGGRWPAVELEIGELVLRGFAPVDRHRIGAAVERELARLLGERAPASQLGQPAERAWLDGGAFELPAGASAETIGTQIARAIYAGIGAL